MGEQTLIATFGSEPQVVTLALDLLRAKGHLIAAVEVVMHGRPGDRISLLPVPVLRWSSVSPVMTELLVWGGLAEGDSVAAVPNRMA